MCVTSLIYLLFYRELHDAFVKDDFYGDYVGDSG